MTTGGTISITGSTYEINVIELTKTEFNRFIKAIKTGDDHWAKNEELEERLREDSIINGFLLEDGTPLFELLVDGKIVSLDKLGADFTVNKQPAPPLTTHLLVLEKWCINSSETHKLSEKFDPAKIELATEDYILPHGTQRIIVTAYYDGDTFDFQGSQTREEKIYIVKMDGEVVYL